MARGRVVFFVVYEIGCFECDEGEEGCDYGVWGRRSRLRRSWEAKVVWRGVRALVRVGRRIRWSFWEYCWRMLMDLGLGAVIRIRVRCSK